MSIPVFSKMIGDFRVPTWFEPKHVTEFFDMWACFHRTEKDYSEQSEVQKNFTMCRAPLLVGNGEAEGQYFHKSSNIGWIFTGKEVVHVFNARQI